MARVTQGIKEMAEADLIPEESYMMRVLSVDEVGDKGWEVARCGFDNPSDKGLVGRRVDYFLGREGNWRGLQRLLQAAQLTELPEDENGDQDTQTSLVGVVFPASITHGERNGMPENRLSPNIDYDWLASVMGPEAAKKEKSAGRKKPETRRRRRS